MTGWALAVLGGVWRATWRLGTASSVNDELDYRAAAAMLHLGLSTLGADRTVIPACSWRGAVVASIVSDGLLAVLLWTTVAHHLRRPGGRPLTPSSASGRSRDPGCTDPPPAGS